MTDAERLAECKRLLAGEDYILLDAAPNELAWAVERIEALERLLAEGVALNAAAGAMIGQTLKAANDEAAFFARVANPRTHDKAKTWTESRGKDGWRCGSCGWYFGGFGSEVSPNSHTHEGDCIQEWSAAARNLMACLPVSVPHGQGFRSWKAVQLSGVGLQSEQELRAAFRAGRGRMEHAAGVPCRGENAYIKAAMR